MCKNGLNSGFLSHLSFIILSLGNVIKVNDNRLLGVIFFAKVSACDNYALSITHYELIPIFPKDKKLYGTTGKNGLNSGLLQFSQLKIIWDNCTLKVK